MKKWSCIRKLLTVLLLALMVTGCAQSVGNFSLLSTNVTSVGIDIAKGKSTKGKATVFMFLNRPLERAINDALNNAGPEYDLLVNVELKIYSFPFFYQWVVTGVAFSTRHMKEELGDAGYQKWLKKQVSVYTRKAIQTK